MTQLSPSSMAQTHYRRDTWREEEGRQRERER